MLINQTKTRAKIFEKSPEYDKKNVRKKSSQ